MYITKVIIKNKHYIVLQIKQNKNEIKTKRK